LDADIKKMNERLKIKEEKEKIEQEKIRLQEEAKQLEEIKLLEEKRILKEEIIRNSPFYTDGNAYAVDVNAKYKYIKITNGTTGAEKIFKSKGVPRKVVLNQNLLSYNNIINYDHGNNLNYTIDIETEEIVAEKYIEPEIMGGGDWDDKLFINEKTIINILVQSATFGSSMAGSFNSLQNLRDGDLKNFLLPYYKYDESLYLEKVTVTEFNDINNAGNSNRGPSDRLNQITATKNSIALGGLDMKDSKENMLWKGAPNVINMMFQDVHMTNSYAPGGTYPDDLEGEPGDDDGAPGVLGAGWAGSLPFLRNALDRGSQHNRAIFFQIGSGNVDSNGDQRPYVQGSLGLVWKESLQALEAEFAGTSRGEKTEFFYDIFKGVSLSNYETANSGVSYYGGLIIDYLERQIKEVYADRPHAAMRP